MGAWALRLGRSTLPTSGHYTVIDPVAWDLVGTRAADVRPYVEGLLDAGPALTAASWEAAACTPSDQQPHARGNPNHDLSVS